ncbi:zinc finger CCCH domain-containing protein [Streptomyces sp. MZ04]|nr:zinc finger CCCH domain-containing protein [Streptomyces sp. MZ04]
MVRLLSQGVTEPTTWVVGVSTAVGVVGGFSLLRPRSRGAAPERKILRGACPRGNECEYAHVHTTDMSANPLAG